MRAGTRHPVETARRRHHRRRRHRREHADEPGIPVYRGRFGPEQAERLLWRAGFGPKPGQAQWLARKGVEGAVHWLTRPRSKRLRGPAPHDSDGHPLAPVDAWGHDHLWWLDRMVRTNAPLVERMTLVWHDWFATSNEGVGSQRLMLQQNWLFRRHALGSFEKLLLDVTRDPAMLIWLSGIDNTKEAPNENYGRELMELFTLGAGRGYTETDVREQARALTGFRNDWDDGIGPHNFRFDPTYHDQGVKRILGKRGRFDWRDSCRLCLTHGTHPSFFASKLWSYFIPTPPSAGTQRQLTRLYVQGRYAIRPVVEAILLHPRLYEGSRMVKPPAVLTAGLLRGSRRAIDTDSWTWIGHLMGQQLFYPPNVAGWDDTRWLDSGTWRGRWTAASEAIGERRIADDGNYRPDTPKRAVERAIAFWGEPDPLAGHARVARGVRTTRRVGRKRGLAEGDLSAPPPERLADAGRHLPRLPDLLTVAHCACEDFKRPRPAGSGLDRRQFIVRGAGFLLSVYGASRLDFSAFHEGVAAAAAGPPSPVFVSVFLAGGVDSLSLLAPVGDPRYRELRPRLALGDSDGTPFSEDPRLRWHPSAASLASLHGEGKVTVMPAIGYDHPDQSHFNSRHFWEVGALDTRLVTGWLGRFVDRVGQPDNPLQGLSLDGELSPGLATARMPVSALNGPGDYDFGAPGVWGDVENWMLDAMPAIGAAHSGSRDPGLRQAGQIAVQSAKLRNELQPFAGQDVTSPVTYPQEDDSDFGKRLAALAAMLAAGLPIRCVSLTAPGDYDTHDNEPEDLAKGLKTTSDALLAFQRDLEARGLADRVLVHVWSEFGRRGEENGSAGTDHGAAGAGFLIGTRAAGRMLGEFPGLANLDEDGNLRATVDFRQIYCGLLEQWLGADAAAVVPDAGRFARPALLK